MRIRCAIIALLLATQAAIASAQGSWRDPSPHRAGFLNVNGARLHYLDWGGRGEFLLLIHGWGSNAHVFDDLAPKLTDRYRVVALTLRGFGESDTVPRDYSLARYAADVRAVLDSLHVEHATIAAHSFGGWVLTETVKRYAPRVKLAVYLDAAFDMRVSDSIVARRPFLRPALVNPQTSTDVMHWLATNFFGMWTNALEAEFRARPRDEDARNAQLARVSDESEHARPDFAALSVPALAICALATPASEFPWLRASDSRFLQAQQYVERERRPQQHAECERFRKSRNDHQTIELTGHHYVFIWHTDEVAQALRARAR